MKENPAGGMSEALQEVTRALEATDLANLPDLVTAQIGLLAEIVENLDLLQRRFGQHESDINNQFDVIEESENEIYLQLDQTAGCARRLEKSDNDIRARLNSVTDRVNYLWDASAVSTKQSAENSPSGAVFYYCTCRVGAPESTCPAHGDDVEEIRWLKARIKELQAAAIAQDEHCAEQCASHAKVALEQTRRAEQAAEDLQVLQKAHEKAKKEIGRLKEDRQ